MNSTDEQRRILLTGGCGYIGSHMCVELLREGYDVVVLDNLSNSTTASLDAVRRITNRSVTFVNADIRDDDALAHVFDAHEFDAVLHFAGLKAVGESVDNPIKYYDNNVTGSLRLFDAMRTAGVNQLVFSSSATVYGIPDDPPVDESAPLGPINPYGQTKLMIENVLRDLHDANPDWRISILRYFNPVGAHVSGEIGEDPNDVPNNLMPYISQVAVGRLPHVRVFGADYPTADGTGVRDYIHVVDLARGHVSALKHLQHNSGLFTHNLGTGTGYSVLQTIAAFEKACGKKIPYQITERRPGDAASSYADPSKALREMGWRAEYDLDRMCADAWRWQSTHPDGFTPQES